MPESQNRGVTSKATDRSIPIQTTKQTVILVATTNHLHDNPTVRLGVPYSVSEGMS
jgi:hypothetical protein